MWNGTCYISCLVMYVQVSPPHGYQVMAAQGAVDAIFTAAREGDVDEVARLLDVRPHLMGGRDEVGRMLLIAAADRGRVRVVRLLLQRGAEVNVDQYGNTALNRAALFNYAEVVSLLLGSGADHSLGNNRGATGLMQACVNGHTYGGSTAGSEACARARAGRLG
jgi:ankyrin repeat protein